MVFGLFNGHENIEYLRFDVGFVDSSGPTDRPIYLKNEKTGL